MKKEKLELLTTCKIELQEEIDKLKILEKFLNQFEKIILPKLIHIISGCKDKDMTEGFKHYFTLKESDNNNEYKLCWNIITIEGKLYDIINMNIYLNKEQELQTLDTKILIYKNKYPEIVLNDLSSKSSKSVIKAMSNDKNLETDIIITNGKVTLKINFPKYFYMQ